MIKILPRINELAQKERSYGLSYAGNSGATSAPPRISPGNPWTSRDDCNEYDGN